MGLYMLIVDYGILMNLGRRQKSQFNLIAEKYLRY